MEPTLDSLTEQLANIAGMNADELAALHRALSTLATELDAAESSADVLAAAERITVALDAIELEAQARAEVQAELVAAGRPISRVRSVPLTHTEPRRRTPLSALKPPSSMRAPAPRPPAGARMVPRALTAAGNEVNADELVTEIAHELDLFARSGTTGVRRLASIVGPFPDVPPLHGTHDAESLTASGGICGPLEVRYELAGLSSSVRPLRNGLPTARADRGGLTWMPSPVLSDVIVNNTSGAVTHVTATQDAANVSKTVQVLSCPSSQSVTVDAVAARIEHGLMMGTFSPEYVRAWITETMAAQARLGEQLTYEKLRAASTQQTAAVELGAWSALVSVLELAGVQYRNRNRMRDGATLRVVLPTWVAHALHADLLKMPPGDGHLDQTAEPAAHLARALATVGLSVIWTEDGARTNNAHGAGAGVPFGALAAGAMADYPPLVEALLFEPDAFLFLDGGTLDYGVIRDSATLARNASQMFVETFEGIAHTGGPSVSLTFEVCASGAVSEPVTATCGPIGS